MTIPIASGSGVAALSADGSLLAVGSDLNHEVQLVDLRQPRPTPLVLPRSFSKPASAVAFSIDGTELAAQDQTAVSSCGTPGDRPRRG